MNPAVAKNIRNTLIYLAGWTLLAIILAFFLRNRFKSLYSENGYERLLLTVSKSRPLVADPCTYSIYGDPPTADGNFAKIFLYCNQSEKSANSFHLGVLRIDSYKEMLMELGRINSFRVEVVDKDKVILGSDIKQTATSWKCYSDHIRINDFEMGVKKKARVECFFNYSEKQIQKLYESQ